MLSPTFFGRALRGGVVVGSYLSVAAAILFSSQHLILSEALAAAPPDTWTAEVVIAEDFRSAPVRQVWARSQARGKRFELTLDQKTDPVQKDRFSKLKTGDAFSLRFRQIPAKASGVLKLRSIPTTETEAGIENVVASTSTTDSGASTAAAVATQRSVIALVVTWPGFSVPSNSAVDAAVFSGAAAADPVLQDTSYSAVGYNPDRNGDGLRDVYGPFSVTKPTDPCDWSQFLTMASQVDNLARAQGIDPSLWQHRAYFLPAEMSCGFAGRAHIGCSSGSCHSQYDSQYLYWNDLVPHELGHNLGMHHSSTDSDDNGVTESEYGDHSCHMGNPNAVVPANAPHRVQNGWLTSAQIADVSGVGTYRIAALDLLPGTTANKHVLRIASGGVPYYISFRRQAAGTYDANLLSSYFGRVSIHRHSGGSSQTRLIGTLGNGESRTLTSGHRLQVVAIGSDYADVSVAGDCLRQAPTLSFSPTVRTTNVRGSVQTYTVTLTNRDGTFCSASSFGLTGTAPASGWGLTLDSATLAVAPGQSGSTGVRVTAPAAVTDGTYLFRVTGTNASDASKTGFAEAGYAVDTIAPSAPTGLTVSLSKQNAATLAWAASTGANSYRVVRNGALLNTTLTNSYKDSALSTCTTYQYYVQAVDSAGNISGSSNTVSVSVGCKGKPR